jgi:uncharacterized lipoprotein YehR (DUF1307 family)
MMKRIYLLGAMMMVMLSVLTLTACGSDSDGDGGGGSFFGDNNEIVGEWATQQTDGDSYMFLERVSLKSNGSFTITDYEVAMMSGTIVDMEKAEYSGNYTAKDGKLTLSANGQQVSYSYTVKGSTLTLMGGDGAVSYDKMDDSIRDVFNKAESTYQQRFKN